MAEVDKKSVSKKAFSAVKYFFAGIARLIFLVLHVSLSATSWLIASLLGGYSAITYGVFLLYGEGYAFICAGVCAITLSAIIFRGLSRAQ